MLYSKRSPSSVLGEKLRRVFIERRSEFFEHNAGDFWTTRGAVSGEPEVVDSMSEKDKDEENAGPKVMTAEELNQMRMEILPQLL